jgi:hypothetical protein
MSMPSVNRTGSHAKKLISWVEDGQSLIAECLRVPLLMDIRQELWEDHWRTEMSDSSKRINRELACWRAQTCIGKA